MWLLAQLVTEITRHPRQKIVAGVDFEWSKDSVTYNLFRFYEVLFGRRYGPNGIGDTIRFESSVLCDRYGRVRRTFGTVESRLVFYEKRVLSLFPKFEFVPIPVPVLAGFPVSTPPFLFSIALDTSASSGARSASATLSYSHTCTGSNVILVAVTYSEGGNASNDVSSLTYNSAAMTNAASTYASGQYGCNAYTITGVPVGVADTVLGTFTTVTSNHWIGTASYSGASQTGQPDNSTTSRSDANPITLTLTTVADNCWTIIGAASGRGFTAGTGTTLRQNPGGGDTSAFLGDSNAAITPAGSTSMSLNNTVGGVPGEVMISIAPAAGGAVTYIPQLLTLNVG